jgi:hypothetical protein
LGGRVGGRARVGVKVGAWVRVGVRVRVGIRVWGDDDGHHLAAGASELLLHAHLGGGVTR